jgi:hypothetical protein
MTLELEEPHMNPDFYVRVERSVDAEVQQVPLLEASPADPNGIDVMFAIRIGEDLVEAFSVRGLLIDGEPHLEVGRVDPRVLSRVTGNILLS